MLVFQSFNLLTFSLTLDLIRIAKRSNCFLPLKTCLDLLNPFLVTLDLITILNQTLKKLNLENQSSPEDDEDEDELSSLLLFPTLAFPWQNLEM